MGPLLLYTDYVHVFANRSKNPITDKAGSTHVVPNHRVKQMCQSVYSVEMWAILSTLPCTVLNLFSKPTVLNNASIFQNINKQVPYVE